MIIVGKVVEISSAVC